MDDEDGLVEELDGFAEEVNCGREDDISFREDWLFSSEDALVSSMEDWPLGLDKLDLEEEIFFWDDFFIEPAPSSTATVLLQAKRIKAMIALCKFLWIININPYNIVLSDCFKLTLKRIILS